MLPSRPEKNQLYYGDNFEVLQRYLRDESVDLVYLDPPFNSRQDYNVLFAEKDGSKSSSQIHAFEDTWEWNLDAERSYEYIMETIGGRVADAMRAFRTFLGNSDMMAYLAMMAPRLAELKRVLKQTGSIYLHCDPTASHYLKMLMDAIFGPQFFRNEVVWRRSRGHHDKTLKRFGAIHDVLLYYSKSDDRLFNRIHTERDERAPLTHDLYVHSDGKTYRKDNCRAPGNRGPRYEWNGHVQHWRFSREEADRLEAEGKIVYSKSGMPRVLRPVDPSKGAPLQDVWVDIDAPNSGSAEILGYPTQKPEALLERIIKASSNEGDLVLDPFCGCGTTIQVAQRVNRRWIGIDITHLAIGLIKKRLSDAFGPQIRDTYEIIGEPTDYSGAAKLAEEDKYQFQWWALGQVGARPTEQKKGADRGIDGRLYFHDDQSGKSKQILFSVKAGGVTVSQIRDLRGTLEREKAEIGVFLCFEEPTRPMHREAAEAGFYKSADGSTYARIQILTIQQLLDGKQPEYPLHRRDATFKQAPKARTRSENLTLPLS